MEQKYSDYHADMPAAGSPILPDFVVYQRGGVYIDLTLLPSPEVLQQAIDGLFSAGHVLRGLDWEQLQSLLYGQEGGAASAGAIKIASSISEFPLARINLYRPLKVDDGQADYIFEPVEITVTRDVPLFTAGEDGQQVQIGVDVEEVTEKTQLDFDEFVAHCWNKGVRFGLESGKIREVIQSGRTERVTVARALAPTDGQDAGVEEQTEALHRSNAPRRLPDGRVDLGQYANRFPQIRQGTLLLMKTPLVPGKAGRDIDGTRVDPRAPTDFILESLAGEGTRIEQHGEREYLVATINGFLTIDAKTNQISVTEKIVNREGVNSKTTGNLTLEGREYEEFGEVQEGRTVEGRSLTFHANVFGRVVSAGGRVLLERNLVGGMALNRVGEIIVKGIASSAVLRVGAGLIQLKRAENCCVVGDRVEIETACQCTILADEIQVGIAEGCVVGGKKVHLGLARAHGATDTIVSLLMPDLQGYERLQEKERAYIAECQDMIQQLKQGLTVMTSQPELQQYLVRSGKIRRKELVLSPDQLGDWQQVVARMAPAMKRVAQAREDMLALETEISGVNAHIEEIETEKANAGAGVCVQLDAAYGEVVVRQYVVPLESPPLTRLQPKELAALLRGPVSADLQLFSGSGAFKWATEPLESPAG